MRSRPASSDCWGSPKRQPADGFWHNKEVNTYEILTWLRPVSQRGAGPYGQWGRGWGLRTPGHGLQNIFINEHFKVSRDGNQMWDRAVGGRARSRDTKGEGWG